MRKHRNDVLLRLTDDELKMLDEMVNKSGLTRSAFIRQTLKGKTIKELPPVDFFEVLKHLRQINNNMNQIAVRANYIGLIDAAAYRKNVEWLQNAVGEMMRQMYS